jgi:hypothetical protein
MKVSNKNRKKNIIPQFVYDYGNYQDSEVDLAFAASVWNPNISDDSDDLIKAFGIFERVLNKDPAYAWNFHCNLVVPMMFEGVDSSVANRSSVRILHSLFGVDMNDNEFYNTWSKI